MHMHAHVEDLVYGFVEFLDNDPRCSRLTNHEPGWEAIIEIHERIDKERKEIAAARKTVSIKWSSKLLDPWSPAEGAPLYSMKLGTINKMRTASERVENERLTRVMMEQIVYRRARKALKSKGQISLSSFPQSSDFNKMNENIEAIPLTAIVLAPGLR